MLKDTSDVSYLNGLKIPSQIVIEVDALLKALTSEQILKIWKIKL